jgi:hypothetical protein
MLAATRAFQHFGGEARRVPERGRWLLSRLKEQGLYVYRGTELRRPEWFFALESTNGQRARWTVAPRR